MNILAQLQELEDLIIENTEPSVTALLRNKLAFPIEQAQKHSTDLEKLEKTFARQIKTIENLAEENKELVAELQARGADPFTEHKGLRFKIKSDGTHHLAAYCASCLLPLGEGSKDKQLTCAKCGFTSIYTIYHLPELVEEVQNGRVSNVA